MNTIYELFGGKDEISTSVNKADIFDRLREQTDKKSKSIRFWMTVSAVTIAIIIMIVAYVLIVSAPNKYNFTYTSSEKGFLISMFVFQLLGTFMILSTGMTSFNSNSMIPKAVFGVGMLFMLISITLGSFYLKGSFDDTYTNYPYVITGVAMAITLILVSIMNSLTV
jgi:magnesium-transporting ATPase (P-type)